MSLKEARAALRSKILEVLGVGGPRKRPILQALANHLGLGAHFSYTITQLRKKRLIKDYFRYGGPHIGLVK